MKQSSQMKKEEEGEGGEEEREGIIPKEIWVEASWGFASKNRISELKK